MRSPLWRLATLLALVPSGRALATPPESSPTAGAQATADDPVLKALRDELARAQKLKMQGLDSPYFEQATLNETDTFNVAASFGALLHRRTDTNRLLNVDVRVGSPELDNTNSADPSRFMSFMQPGAPVPRADDYDALREALWLQFDAAYKGAVEGLARKRAYLQTNDVPERAPDFGPAPVAEVLLPRAKVQTNPERWTALVKRASAVFRDPPHILTGTASYQAMGGTQWFVSSDPVKDRISDTLAEVSLSATAQAPDGMELEAHWSARGRTDADLPKDEEIVEAARALTHQLQALAQAPLLPDDYSGPVLFTGGAANRFFLAGFGDALSHPREPLGSSHEGRLVDRIGRHIATSKVTVRDDPTLTTWHGTPLLGWFPVDDDGVKPQPITLVEKGILKTYYMSRVPTLHVAASNGHSRAGEGGPGNLFVETSEPMDRMALKQRLIDLVKDQGLDYGIWVEELRGAGASAMSPLLMQMMGGGGGGGEIQLAAPALAYRIFADGHEELVRGASFKPISFRALDDIEAMGDDPQVLNTQDQGQSVAVVAPSVLVKQLELKKPSHEFEKHPITPRPP